MTDYPNSDQTPSIARQVDLSGYSNATLSFDWSVPSTIDTSDGVVVEISSNGGSSYTTLETFTGYNGATSSSRSYNISSYISANTKVRFRVTLNIGVDDEYFAVDNVQILATGAGSSVTKDNNTSNAIPNLVNGTPPNLVAAADGFTLSPNQTMTVTFQASVTASAGTLVNTAWTKSNQSPNPIQSSVVNNVGSDDQLCYAVADGTTSSSDSSAKDTLANLNRVSGATTIVNGTVGNTNRYNIEAIAFQPGSTTLYAADAGQLGILNLTTGLFTATSNSFGSGSGSAGSITFNDVDGLSFDPITGFLYGTHRRDSDPDVLFRINPTTGQRINDAFGADEYKVVTLVSSSLEDVDDIAVDPSTGVMYAILNNGGSSESRLVTINMASGVATSVGTVKRNGSNVQDIEGLSFFNDGKLYGSSGKDGPTTNALYQINKSTAAATLIGQFPSPLRDFEALGCFTGPASIDVEKSTNGFDADNAPGPTLPAGIGVTWRYTATNTGSIKLIDVTIVDDKEGAICDIGALNPSQSLSCTKSGIAVIGQYENTATASGKRFDNSQVVQDTDPSHYKGVGSNPNYTIQKANNTDPELNGVRQGDPISFTIHIANTGDVPITILPMQDTYTDTYLSYAGTATPTPNGFSAGQIDWTDLTTTTVNGFGVPLGIGQSFDVIVNFIAQADTTSLPGGVTYNTATVLNAFYDPDGPGGLPPQSLPSKSATAPAKIIAPAAIGDFVWYDADKDGIQDVAEPGIPNVTLDLYKDTDGTPGLNTATDTKVGSTVTDADGGYLFIDLEPGTYFVDVTDIGGKLVGLTHIVVNQSQSNPTPAIVLPSGGIYKDADFGYVKNPGPGNAIVGDTVWYDANGDGVQQPSEPGIPNVTVNVRNSSGTIIGTADTDANGHYLVEVPAGSGYTATPDPADIPAGLTATTPVPHPLPPLSAGEQYLDADFGYNGPGLGTIGNLVFGDSNNNGVFNSGSETGLPGVSVDLIRNSNGNTTWDSSEPVIATVTTDKNGGYLFTGVPEGNYLVHVSDTNATLINYTKSNLGTAGVDNNNQADPYPIKLPAGTSNLTADFGYRKIDPSLGQIGNQVWTESDANGLFNPTGTDVGQAGVTVKLYRNGSAYATTTTGASGDYLFPKLPSGTYTVTVSDSFNVLSGWIVTTLGPNQASDDNNQQQPYQIVLATGGENMTADFGYIQPGAIGDFVFYDTDKDGIQDVGEPGIPNVALNLYRDKDGSGTITAGDPLVKSTVTDADGGYLFRDLIPGKYIVDVTAASNPNGNLGTLTHTLGNQSASDPTPAITLVGGTVYKDADFGYVQPTGPGKALIGDTVWYDANGDGVQQPGESGIPGITVRATATTGSTYEGVTDGTGTYKIEVPTGTYTVTVVNPPAGLTVTTDPIWGPNILLAGEQRLDADFGYNGVNVFGTIGNLVFWDKDHDGVYNNSDVALGGVSVDLIQDSNGNKVWDTGEPIIATTTTASATDASFGNTGNYLFTGLVAGNYLVHVSDTNAVLFDFEKSVLGSNQTANNHNKADPYAINLGVAQNNLTADFGYYRRPNQPKVGVIGNQIWIETDLNGLFDVLTKDRGQVGVTVDLYEAGVKLATTTSGASGDYSFVHLPSGAYTVAVSDNQNVLTGLSVTTLGPSQGSDNNNQQQPYTVGLAEGGVNLTADFGYVFPSSSFTLTKTLLTPSPVRNGTTISFSIRITNTGPSWLMRLPLIDTYDTEYIGYLSGNPASVDKANDGTINWTDLLSGSSPLAPGGSVEVIVYFVGINDTGELTNSVTINVATVSGAISDPDGLGPASTNPTPLPDQSAQDVVEIINPTALLVTNSQVTQEDNGALLAWQTVSEANVAGFNLLRINPDSSTALLTNPSLPAQKPGQAEGASYSWVDSSAGTGQSYIYLLEIIGLDGFTQQVTLGQFDGQMRLFLPVTSR